jgi:hypothetical protein
MLLSSIVTLLSLACILFYVANVDYEGSNNTESTGDVAGVRTFYEDFSRDLTLEESGKLSNSKNPSWWLSSGAFMYQEDGIGKTVQGDLAVGSKWQKKYASNNPDDTDDGLHPQNIFRLTTRSRWKDFTQEAYFRINYYNLSESSNRSGSNGLFFFNRYKDENNLYYTGIRVDGAAVIKKKVGGVYHTMAYKQVYEGSYDRTSNPNLLPTDAWIGIRSTLTTESDGSVKIKLYLDRERDDDWESVLEAKDDGKNYGGNTIFNAGYAGIRTDFMDAEFDDFKITAL